MDKKTIQKLAIKAGFEPYEVYHLSGNSEDDRLVSVGEYPCGESVIKFAELVAKAERERCAAICDNLPVNDPAGSWFNDDMSTAAYECAATIRSAV